MNIQRTKAFIHSIKIALKVVEETRKINGFKPSCFFKSIPAPFDPILAERLKRCTYIIEEVGQYRKSILRELDQIAEVLDLAEIVNSLYDQSMIPLQKTTPMANKNLCSAIAEFRKHQNS